MGDATRARLPSKGCKPTIKEVMLSKKSVMPARSNEDVRGIILKYFYERNAKATSARGKNGAAVKISDVKRDLKATASLSQTDVWSNLNYLISQGWIAQDLVHKSVPLKSGTIIPQVTTYYKVSAPGIDKIEGSGAYTMDKFRGIRIEATGQNIITMGDGNQVDAKFSQAASSLAAFKDEVRASTIATDSQKLDIIADVDSIQSQLAKRQPNAHLIDQIWSGVEKCATLVGLAAAAAKVKDFLQLIPNQP